MLDHPDRLIPFDDPNFPGSYLDCPAAKLPGSKLLGLGDPKLLDAALALMVAFQDSRSEPRDTAVVYAFELRDDQEMKGCEAKLHPELLGYFIGRDPDDQGDDESEE